MMIGKGRPRIKAQRPDREWAQRIRQARVKAGLSQAALGDAVGKGQTTINQYESGQTEPNIAMFTLIAKVLGTSPAWLILGHPDDGDTDVSDEPQSREEENWLFAWTLHRAAKMLAEEGLDSDLTYLTLYTKKIMRAAEHVTDDADSKELILRAIETERLEFRQRKNEIRKKSL